MAKIYLKQRLSEADLRRVIADVSAREDIPPGYRLDLAKLEDLDGLLEAARQCFDYDTPERAELRYFLTRAHAAFFVFRRVRDRAIAGYVLLEANRRTRIMYGNTTCVVPACQGLGLGRIFYFLKKRTLAVLGYKAVTAHVAVDNDKTIHLLQKSGFDITGRIDDYYEDGRDAYTMRMENRP